MQHKIPTAEIGPRGEKMAAAVEACVHCGFCLPDCPTYQELGEEMDSPRGRIILMKEVLEGNLSVAGAAPYIDRCLGCLGCVTACPSGVAYDELITSYRGHVEDSRQRTFRERLLRRLLLSTLPYPGRFRFAIRSGRLLRPLARFLPAQFAAMLSLLPAGLPRKERLPELTPAEGERRGRVALLAGCAQQVLAPQINSATVRVLAKNGVEVVVPRGQRCCGALAAHTGAAAEARSAARHNTQVFPHDVDAVITNAAGCGSGLHEYPLWLAGEEQQAAAEELAARAIDISQYLVNLGPRVSAALSEPLKVVYHDACHLAHGQGVRSAPRQLLESISNLQLCTLPDSEICCGSAGSYSIEQPQIANQLGVRKAEAVLASGADLVATGNIGCMTQIETHLQRLGKPVPVQHTIELLDRAYAAGGNSRR